MGQLNYIIRIIDYAHGFPHSKESLLLDGISLPSGQLSEEQAVASAHVALKHTRRNRGGNQTGFTNGHTAKNHSQQCSVSGSL